MVDFKSINMESLTNHFVLGILLLVITAVIMTVIGPVLTTILPTVFAKGITLTDTLLLLILLRLHNK